MRIYELWFVFYDEDEGEYLLAGKYCLKDGEDGSKIGVYD